MGAGTPTTEEGPGATPARRPHHGNRHGRSEEGRQAVLRAADDLLVEQGFDGVTMEGIARRAGVAKQTIYRWWKSKADVLLDAFLQDTAEELEPGDEGDLAVDLAEYLGRLARFLADSDTGKVFRALTARAQLDPEFAEEFRAKVLRPQRLRGMLLLERGVSRGQLPVDLDVETQTVNLVSPIFYRVLVTGEPVDRRVTDELAQAFLQRYGTTGTGS